MKAISLILGLCPGFGGLVHYGRVSHLFTMLLFLLSLNTIIFLDFYWMALVPAGLKKWTFILLGAIWVLLSFIADCYSRKYEKIEKGDATGEKFLEILTVYLRGDWEGAERLAKLEMRQNPRDVEIALFLATFYRHRERYLEATKMHEILERLEGAERWYYEIYVEKNALNRAMNGSEEDEEEADELTESESAQRDSFCANSVNSDSATNEPANNDLADKAPVTNELANKEPVTNDSVDKETVTNDSATNEKSESELVQREISKDNVRIPENNVLKIHDTESKNLENEAAEKAAIKNEISGNEIFENIAVENKAVENETIENKKTRETDLEEIIPCDIESSAMNSSEAKRFATVSFVTRGVDTAILESSTSAVKTSPVNSSAIISAGSVLSDADTFEDNSQAINSSEVNFSSQNSVRQSSEEFLEPFHLRIVHPEDSEVEINRPQLWDSAEEENGPQQRVAR